jgi:ketosteroid isomerase-like protein
MGNQDWDAVLALLHPDVVWSEFGRTDLSKSQLVPEFKYLQTRLTPDWISFEVQWIIAEGDQVSSLTRGRAQTVEGARYDNVYTHWYIIQDGLIVRADEHYDTHLVRTTIKRDPPKEFSRPFFA